MKKIKSLSKRGISDIKLFKIQLIEKLKQYEEEQKKIKEIAKIEEENKILNQIK